MSASNRTCIYDHADCSWSAPRPELHTAWQFPRMICPPENCDPQYVEEIATFRGDASNLTTFDYEAIEGLGDRRLISLQANQYGQPLDQLELRIRALVEDYRRHYTALSSSVD